MSEYDDLLREAYLGELFGDTFFATMAERQPDKERREKLETLQIVEARTAQSLRRLIDRKGLDAVLCATPDHHHAFVTLAALRAGLHVYCEKPLTHTVHEARQMRLVARKYRVVTQMGNQIQSHQAYRTAVKLVHEGRIGKVKEVISWQGGAMRWMLVDDRPGGEPVFITRIERAAEFGAVHRHYVVVGTRRKQ